MAFISPEVPDGEHPWAPAERDFASKIQPEVEAHLAIAVTAIKVGGDVIDRAQGRRAPDLFQVHATLLVRVLQDLRASVLCTLAGYPMQGWTVATSAFEAAHTLGYIGSNVDRARQWLHHTSKEKPFIPAYAAVTGTVIYLGIEPEPAKRNAVIEESFGLYRFLCMAKHANPIAERDRYTYVVQGRPNLVFTPPYTPRRAAEARLGLLLAVRSAQIALWAFDVTHVAPSGYVDDRIGAMAEEIDRLAGSWQHEVEQIEGGSDD